jgi:hypothetical protein
VAASIVGLPAALAWPATADDNPDPIRVATSGFPWVNTTVVDGGIAAHSKGKSSPKRRAARTCTQSKSPSAGGYASSDQFTGDYPNPGPGGWVIRRCSDGTMDTAWVPAPIGPVDVTPQRLAQRATNRLPLPLPAPRFDPSRPSSAGPSTLVNVPTWFFLGGWTPVRQRTQAGGVWAEVTATPVGVTWIPGDGGPPVRCKGAGRPWVSDTDTAGACRYTYLRSSAAQPGLAYAARVVVDWQVTWQGSGGRSGSLPLMQRQIDFPVAVAERQTVVTVGGGA